MSNKMLIDATHPEETRVVIVRDKRVEDFDFETASKRPLRGNIYLAKVTRVEPSLQAAFVEYGGNRHGFLAFSEIHPDYYQIPQADRAALLAELEAAADAEERGGRESSGSGSSSGGSSRSSRRRRGGRGGDRPRPEARADDAATSDESGGVVEVVEEDEEIVEAGFDAADEEEASGDEADDDESRDEAGADAEDEAVDPERRAAERDEDAAWLRAVAEDDKPAPDAPKPAPSTMEEGSPEGWTPEDDDAEGRDVPGERRKVSETGEIVSGDIAAEVGRGVSSDDAPAALDRARRQVEENIEADVEAAIDSPLREFEVDRGDTPDADSASRTGDDTRDPPVARNAAAADATATPDAAAEPDAPAKPRRTRKPAAAKPAAAKPAAKARSRSAAKAAADEPAPEAAADEGGSDAAAAPEAEAQADAPKARRAPAKRTTTRRTTKKSDTGLADPSVADEDEADEVIEQVGGDAGDEVQERRRFTPRKQYKIQEVIKRRQILLVQVVKEERGTKGAALTTYLSLAGRYSVLMPNTDRGGGVSRKITDSADRRRLKELVEELDVPEGMGIILRTAGANRTTMEIKRDFEYLIRLWESVRDLTLKSIAPALVYEEGNLVKRAIRDQYSKEIDEILVAGDSAYEEARGFMKMLMPSQEGVVKPYREATPIFTRYGVESQLDAMFSPQVTLPSRGYIVINPTEALVSIDVNSGRSTKEHSIEDTALKTNLEAADEVARQLRLRDLAGLIVIDFIDMDDKRHNRQVEARLKNALRLDRSRIQIGRISPFGLLEMSRQRMRQGMVETSMVPCATCGGTGHVRSTQSVALHCLRMLEEHLLKHGDNNVTLKTSSSVALYILNQKRAHLNQLEERFALEIEVHADEALAGQHLEIVPGAPVVREAPAARALPDMSDAEEAVEAASAAAPAEGNGDAGANGERGGSSRRRRRRRRRGAGDRPEARSAEAGFAEGEGEVDDEDGLDEEVAGGDAEGALEALDEAASAELSDEEVAAFDSGDTNAVIEALDDAASAELDDEEVEALEADAAADEDMVGDEAATVRESEAGAIDGGDDDSADVATPAADNDAGEPERAPEQKSEPDRPRRSGWWNRRLFSGG